MVGKREFIPFLSKCAAIILIFFFNVIDSPGAINCLQPSTGRSQEQQLECGRGNDLNVCFLMVRKTVAPRGTPNRENTLTNPETHVVIRDKTHNLLAVRQWLQRLHHCATLGFKEDKFLTFFPKWNHSLHMSIFLWHPTRPRPKSSASWSCSS